jgi:hypothetical protein
MLNTKSFNKFWLKIAINTINTINTRNTRKGILAKKIILKISRDYLKSCSSVEKIANCKTKN